MVLEKYVTALVADKQYEKAASVMIDNLRLNPIVSKNEYEHYRYIVFKLIESGDAAFKAGKRDEALRLYAIAKVLDSSNERALKRYQGAKSGKGYTEVVEKPQNELLKKQETYGDRVKKLRGKISNEPSNFQAYVDLDHALARHHRFDEVVKMWDEYISKNQNDARAYLERGGAYFHSKDFARAYEDANKACKLGLDEGCKRAKQVAGKVPIGKLKSVK